MREKCEEELKVHTTAFGRGRLRCEATESSAGPGGVSWVVGKVG